MKNFDDIFVSLDHGNELNISQSLCERSSSIFAESGREQLETPTTTHFIPNNISVNLLAKVPKDVEFWTLADVCGICFESVDQAEELYRAYSVKMSFSIRRSNMETNASKIVITMRRWVCNL